MESKRVIKEFDIDKLIEGLKELRDNCDDNALVGLASALLCALDLEHFN